VDDRTARRLRWLVPPGLILALALGWAIGPASAFRPPPQLPSPVFGADDGLPEQLVAGTEYSARFIVSFPADWPIEESSNRGSFAILSLVARGRPDHIPPDQPEVYIIYCSRGYPHAAGQTVVAVCPLAAHDPGPFDLYLSAEPSLFKAIGPGVEAKVDDTTHVYHHTVVAGTPVG